MVQTCQSELINKTRSLVDFVVIASSFIDTDLTDNREMQFSEVKSKNQIVKNFLKSRLTHGTLWTSICCFAYFNKYVYREKENKLVKFFNRSIHRFVCASVR